MQCYMRQIAGLPVTPTQHVRSDGATCNTIAHRSVLMRPHLRHLHGALLLTVTTRFVLVIDCVLELVLLLCVSASSTNSWRISHLLGRAERRAGLIVGLPPASASR